MMDDTVLIDRIIELTDKIEQLEKCYAVTNESWKRLAGENERFREDITDANIQMAYRDKVIQRQCEALKVARSAMYTHLQINGCDCLKNAIKAVDKALAEVMGE